LLDSYDLSFHKEGILPSNNDRDAASNYELIMTSPFKALSISLRLAAINASKTLNLLSS